MTGKDAELTLRLERIIRLRLRFSKRWRKVKVSVKHGNVIVKWFDNYGTEWKSHTKEIPMSDLPKYVKSQESKLMNEFKNRVL
jgi:predicted GTPase